MTARMRGRAPRRAMPPEREQLAYDLHDGICQELTGISLLLVPLRGTARRVAPELISDLEQVACRVNETLNLARNLALEWAGCKIDSSADFEATLRAHIERLRRDHPVTVALEVGSMPACGLAAPAQLGKIVCEAMRNAVLHGQARTIEVALRDRGRDWQLEISDDGAGFGRGACGRACLGLRSMRYRASRLGGALEIVPRSPQGTRVIVCWPKAPKRTRGNTRSANAPRRERRGSRRGTSLSSAPR